MFNIIIQSKFKVINNTFELNKKKKINVFNIVQISILLEYIIIQFKISSKMKNVSDRIFLFIRFF